MKKINQCIYFSIFIFLSILIMQSCKKSDSSAPTQKNLSIADVVHLRYDGTGDDTTINGNPTSTGTDTVSNAGTYSDVDKALANLNWSYFAENHDFDSTKYTPYSLHLPSTYTGDNSRVYLIGSNKAAGFFPVYNSSWFYNGNNYSGSDQSTFVNYLYMLPSQSQWKLLTISVVGNQLYYALTPVQITAGGSTTASSLTQISETDLANVINNL